MEVLAKHKYARISAQKCRLVADTVRNAPVEVALEKLRYSTKKASDLIFDVVNSAIANAEHNHGMDIDALYVSTIMVDEAPTLKRHRARAKGRGAKILKRGCHITVKVKEREGV